MPPRGWVFPFLLTALVPVHSLIGSGWVFSKHSAVYSVYDSSTGVFQKTRKMLLRSRRLLRVPKQYEIVTASTISMR